MSSLYEISETYKKLQMLAECADDESLGSAIDEAFELLNEELADKIDNCAGIIRYWQAMAEGCKIEAQRMKEREAHFNRRIDALKTRMLKTMEQSGQRKVEGQRFTASIRKGSARVVIDDEDQVPDWFKVEQAPKISKAAIKEAINNGTDIAWAHIETGPETITIK